MQHSNHLLMIKPVRFDFNAETAVNNSFQTNVQDVEAQEKAAAEFTQFISVLRSHGIDVTVVEDTPDPHTPDSIFPNNWISFHTDGTVCLYPMYAKNRRLERKPTVLKMIEEKFSINRTIDLTHYEQDGIFLEGTGSMVLDRENKIAYACLSPRTDEKVLTNFCMQLSYTPVVFWALDAGNQPIYHTNVMMCVADKYVVICLDSIKNETEKANVVANITATKKRIIEISLDQMNHFAGNMLQVHNEANEPFLVMSSQAYRSLMKDQIGTIETFNRIIHSDITTIETNGGGSARCMMAEVFLPVK
ncbi:MAG: amidinotransferase [Chitinophagaceae bacterium]|nr:amidinotransferase [Chitinophagaceae bacterium]